MSRPFSYNDENFNVIGNVVFLHIKLTNLIAKNNNIVEIPPEIYKRMLHKSNYLMYVRPVDGASQVSWVSVGTRKSESDEKYYLYSASDIGTIGNYLIGYYILKDI